MNAKATSSARHTSESRQSQERQLSTREAELGNLASEGRCKDFLERIPSLLQPLKDYIKRRLRVAYFEMQIRTPVYTSGDILDHSLLRACGQFRKKPKELSLEQWLYQITNQVLERYISRRAAVDKRRRSLEALNKTELSTLEEKPTANAEGEPVLEEDLDDISYHLRDFTPPAEEQQNPEQKLETKEELERIVRALASVPQRDRIVFELFAMEGFSKEEVAQIINIPAAEVPRIAEGVRKQVLDQLRRGESTKAA